MHWRHDHIQGRPSVSPFFIPDVSLLCIPKIAVAVGFTHDMSQYINDPAQLITNSQIIGINPAIATYSHATKFITGVSLGTLVGVQLEATF